MQNKKLNLKKLCLLLGLCMSVFAAMPNVLADPPPKRYPSIAVPAMPDVPGALNPGHQPAKQLFPFTPEEDAIIIDHVAQYGPKKWGILESRIPNHSRKSCRERWHNYLNPEINHNPWTDEEDQIILDKFNEFGRQWSKIAQFLPGKTNQSVHNRWNLLNRQRTGPKARVPWTPEEDQILINRFYELGHQWVKIAQFLPGRSVGCVKSRWEILNIRQNGFQAYVPWTPEEDKILLDKEKELGRKWTQIAQFLPGRTVSCVKARWKLLNIRERALNASNNNSGQVIPTINFNAPVQVTYVSNQDVAHVAVPSISNEQVQPPVPAQTPVQTQPSIQKQTDLSPFQTSDTDFHNLFDDSYLDNLFPDWD